MKFSVLAVCILLSMLVGCSANRITVPESDKAIVGLEVCNEEHPDHTVGLKLCREEMFRGYTLYAPLLAPKAYLIDHLGRKVHEWNLRNKPAGVVFLLDNGMLLTTGKPDGEVSKMDNGGPNTGGIFRLLDWNSNVVWEYRYANDKHRAHHDTYMMPNGNILIVAWEPKSKDEAVAMGRNPKIVHEKGFMPDHIVEVKPTKEGAEIVWEWHVWDHLVQNVDPSKPNYGNPQEHPELIDVNFQYGKTPSWNHVNGIDYNEKLDQIVLSVNNFNELWVIDHSTTTAEAASHSGGRWGKGGDLLYRWGNPQTYGGGSTSDRVFYLQHNAQWIRDGLPGAGHFLVFNNGKDRKGNEYSTVDELAPEFDQNGGYLTKNGRFTPEGVVWSYKAENPKDFYSEKISGAQRLPNGNTLICSGMSGVFFEVTPDGRKVWEYVNPAERNGVLAQGERSKEFDKTKDTLMNNAVFRVSRIAPDHPGLKNRDLTPKGVIEKPAR